MYGAGFAGYFAFACVVGNTGPLDGDEVIQGSPQSLFWAHFIPFCFKWL
jgi:hypothetical protein